MTTCGAFGSILGGYGAAGGVATLQKTYEDLPAHDALSIRCRAGLGSEPDDTSSILDPKSSWLRWVC